MFQLTRLFRRMSVLDNLLVAGYALGLNRQQAQPHARAILAKLQLESVLHLDAGQLSGGQQKMLEFAKAYLLRPRLCLIDEPSIGLSPKVAAEVYRWIDLFVDQQTAILLVDHNVRRVVKMARYVYVLSLGRITAEGAREDFEGDLHEQVRRWVGITF